MVEILWHRWEMGNQAINGENKPLNFYLVIERICAMKRTRPKIFITGLTLLVFSFSTPGQSGTLYHCVNSKGSIFLTDNVPTDPDFKCTFSTSYKDLTPQERAKEQREADADRQRMRAANAKHDAEKRAAVAKQEEPNRRANQASDNNQSKTPDSAYEIKRKELADNFRRAYKEYHEEEKQRLQRNGKQPSSREKSLRAAMFAAQEAEHAYIFSPENLSKGGVVTIKTTMTVKRSKAER